MKQLLLLLTGVLFGVTMYKAEAASWFRIYEMFRFESFHMYGIIGSALLIGVLFVLFIKKRNGKDIYGNSIKFTDKNSSIKRYLIGGIIFGLGWALTGACPGPLFVLLGSGVWSVAIVIAAAILGTFSYGLLRDKLPH